jgi:heme exporter protein CcmD
MSDHELFIWGSYGVFAAALLIEIILLRARARRTLDAAREDQLVKSYETKT